MANTTCFVITYSIIILALFGVFSYLMSTVNPPPLNPPQRTEHVIKSPSSNTFLVRRMGANDDLQYGLQKTKDVSHLARYPVIPKEHDVVKVSAPLWSPTTVKPTIITKTKHASNNSLITTQTQSSHILQNFSIKGHRRSINGVRNKTISSSSGSLILKVLDGGEPRIEIRLSPNEIIERKRSRIHRSSTNDSQYNLIIEGNDEMFTTNELEDSVEIKILTPSNTSIIINTDDGNNTDEYEDLSSVSDSVQIISAHNESAGIRNTNSTTTKHIADLVVDSVEPSKWAATEQLKMKLMFDNVTRHLRALTKL